MRLIDNSSLIYDDNSIHGFPNLIPFTRDILNFDFSDFDTLRTGKLKTNGLHFFCDDYKFQCIWNKPAKYINFLKSFNYIIMPDFSLYFDHPLPLKMYNKYKNHWLFMFYFCVGIHMIPNVNLGSFDDFEWSIEGFPEKSIIAVSDIGRSKYIQDRVYKTNVIDFIRERLNPIEILYFTRSTKNIPDNVNPMFCSFIKAGN